MSSGSTSRPEGPPRGHRDGTDTPTSLERSYLGGQGPWEIEGVGLSWDVDPLTSSATGGRGRPGPGVRDLVCPK